MNTIAFQQRFSRLTGKRTAEFTGCARLFLGRKNSCRQLFSCQHIFFLVAWSWVRCFLWRTGDWMTGPHRPASFCLPGAPSPLHPALRLRDRSSRTAAAGSCALCILAGSTHKRLRPPLEAGRSKKLDLYPLNCSLKNCCGVGCILFFFSYLHFKKIVVIYIHTHIHI